MKTSTVWARREGNGSDGRKLDQDLCVRLTIYHILFCCQLAQQLYTYCC
jgi:hypothetical protein